MRKSPSRPTPTEAGNGLVARLPASPGKWRPALTSEAPDAAAIEVPLHPGARAGDALRAVVKDEPTTIRAYGVREWAEPRLGGVGTAADGAGIWSRGIEVS